VTFSETPQSCGGWHPLQVNHDRNADFHGWWQQTGNRIKTVVAAPPPRSPIALRIQTRVTRPGTGLELEPFSRRERSGSLLAKSRAQSRDLV